MITKEEIMNTLTNVYDPELMVNIVDLGLIYDVIINKKSVEIKMTLTSYGCPVAPTIERNVIKEIKTLKNVKDVQVEFVWYPAWTPEMMTDEAKLELGYVTNATITDDTDEMDLRGFWF